MREQRRKPRFDLILPLEVLRVGRKRIHASGQTRNVSSCGVLFEAPLNLEVGDAVEYLIRFPVSSPDSTKVYVRCLGKVVRKAGTSSESADLQATAVTLERYSFVREKTAQKPTG